MKIQQLLEQAAGELLAFIVSKNYNLTWTRREN